MISAALSLAIPTLFLCQTLPLSQPTVEINYESPSVSVYLESGEQFADRKAQLGALQNPATKKWELTLAASPEEDFRKAFELRMICDRPLSERQNCPALLSWTWGNKIWMSCRLPNGQF